MNKIKLMLLAIAVFALIGGLLAYSAKKAVNQCYYSSTTSHNGFNNDFCNYNIVSGGICVPGGNFYGTCAVKVNGQCPTTVTCTQKFSSREE